MSERRTVRAACPHDCPDGCAMLVTVEDGRAVKVEGDPEHPVTAGFLCGKVATYIERTYADDRLLHPLVRTGRKGEGAFRRVTWDEALDRVATGLQAAVDRHGGESVLPYSYYGTMGVLQYNSMSARFMHAIGATRLGRTVCANAGIAGVKATNGISPEVDPEEWVHARYLLLVGWNPLSTAPHLWRFVLEARRRGARLVVVDPYRSRTARVADEHVQPLPGTDGALALGLLRALADEGLTDEDWCREHTEGYDELLERLGEYPVERCAAICDVDEATLRRLAREFATTQPSLLRLGVGGQHHLGAPAAYRALACIPALVGSWRHRGGGFSFIPSATSEAIDSSALGRPDLLTRQTREINMAQVGDALTDPDLAPPVAALVVWNSNPAAIAPDQNAVLRGLERDDLFTVVLEQFPTDTVRYADVVLPATTQLEHLDLHWSWGHHYVTINEPAVAPLGEAKPNTEIFRLLARRLGLADACFDESDEELLASLFDGGHASGLDLGEIRRHGWTKVDLGQGPTPHAEGRFGTPSGKLQLRAPDLEAAGFDPLPGWEPPAETVDEAAARDYGLCLLTPKTQLFLNSTFANGRKQAAAQPRPFVAVHPDDAARRQIRDGDEVRVYNARGSFVCEARVTDDVRRGVAVAPMGWWNQSFAGGLSSQTTTSQRVTAIGGHPGYNDNRVEIEPVVGANAPSAPAAVPEPVG